MSFGSRLFFALALAIVMLSYSVDAHAWMSSPAPRGQYTSPPKRADLEYAPTRGDTPDSPEFVCRNDPEMPKASWLPLTAGKSQSIHIQFNAAHPGDCFVYLTYDGDKPVNQMKWFKIWAQHECYKKSDYQVPIPSYLPSGDHVIFRWEWYALHVHPVVEYYAQCVDATISGASAFTQAALPQPQVNIPGHLPKSAGSVMDDTNNYWWPYDYQKMFFTGPAVATLNGQPNPTQNPTPTEKPTERPTTPTQKPTERPYPTQKPTERPTPTPTSAATPRPTQRPTSTPTSAPPATAPTTRPGSESAKLTVHDGSSVWWFAAAISGVQTNDISKVEVRDSANVSGQMSYGWSNVYTFDPSGRALSLPLTVKVTSKSGSSVSFSVNSLSSATIDSGSVLA